VCVCCCCCCCKLFNYLIIQLHVHSFVPVDSNRSACALVSHFAPHRQPHALPISQHARTHARTIMSAPAVGCCVSCGKLGATALCPCRTVRYCDRVCQQAHWKTAHKGQCPLRSLLPKQYPREETIAKLREALPEYVVEDHSDMSCEALHPLLDRLKQPGNDKVLAIVIRVRKIHTVTASETLFQILGEAMQSNAISAVAGILVYHKDNFRYVKVLEFAELVKWIRDFTTRGVTDTCMICQHDTRVSLRGVCEQCKTNAVCDDCAKKIQADSPNKEYKCPACQFTPPCQSFICIPAKPVAAAAALYVFIKIRVDFIPPAMYKNVNHEQHFFLPVRSAEDLQPVGDELVGIGCQVREQAVRMAVCGGSVDDMDFASTGPLPESELSAEEKAVIAAARQTNVPVVLHYEPAILQLTAVGTKADGTQHELWRHSLPYHTESQLCVPRPTMASTWKRNEAKSHLLELKDKSYKILQEPYEYEGPEYTFVIHKANCCRVQLTVQRVVNKATREPMSFYVDRVWAVRKIAVIGKKDLFPLVQ
jgi:hypothetical protein